jgi:hypothetical protein
MTSSQHGLYILGYTHATMVGTMGSEIANGANPPKPAPVQIAGCNPPA